MSAKLRTLEGNDHKGVMFVLRVDTSVKHYREIYGEYLEESGEHVSLVTWALERLCNFTAASYQSEDDLRMHVQALGRICGRSPEQSRKMAKNL